MKRILLPAAVLLLTTAAFILSKSARDGLYFERSGLESLPWAYLGITLLAWPVAMAAMSLMQRVGPRKARLRILAAVAGLNLLLAVIGRPGGGWLMTGAFVAIPLVYGVSLSTGWLLGAERLGGTRISRPDAYAFLGSASMAGGLLGALLARWIGSIVGPNGLFGIATAVLLTAVVCATLADATRADRGSAARRHLPLMPGRPRFLLREPYTRWLLVLAGLGGAVGIFVEFQFYLAATGTAGDLLARTEFFANFYTLLMLGALGLQILVVPRVQERIGVRGSLMVLPVVLVGAGAALVFGSALIGTGGLRLAEGGLRASIHRSNWEQIYLPFEGGLRDVAKLVVDGMGSRFAEGLAAVVLLVWMRERPPEALLSGSVWIPYTVVGAALAWLMTLWWLRMPAQCEDRSQGAPGIPESCVMTATLGKCMLAAEGEEPAHWTVNRPGQNPEDVPVGTKH